MVGFQRINQQIINIRYHATRNVLCSSIPVYVAFHSFIRAGSELSSTATVTLITDLPEIGSGMYVRTLLSIDRGPKGK